jgi:hypothetical protein
MVGIVLFHIAMLLLGLGILVRLVPESLVGNALGYVHNAIGITTPSEKQVRLVALIWLGSVIVLVDGCLFLLVFIATSSGLSR